jgi:hypothetical protein
MSTDLINLKDDGEAEFVVIDRDGNAADYEQVRQLLIDAYDEDEVNEAFRFKCRKCGSEECGVEDHVQMGSEWTGLYGDASIVCRGCGAYRIIWDP